MATIAGMLRKVNNVKLADAAAIAIDVSADDAVDLQLAQLGRGEKADGSSMPNYSNTSVTVFGKPAGPIRLYDQGSYYRSIIAKGKSFTIELTATDEKAEMLKARYSPILGLNSESKAEFILKVRPRFIDAIIQQMKEVQ